MGIVFRQSAKNLIVTATGAAMGVLVVWLSTTWIPQRGFGSISTLTNYAVTLGQFLLFGLNNTIAVYIHRYDEQPERKKLLFTLSLIVPGAIAVFFTLACIGLKPWLLTFFNAADQPFMDRYFMWLPVFVVFFIYMIILEQYLASQMKVAVAAFVKEVIVRILNIALIILYGIGLVDFDVLVGGTVMIYVLPILILVFLSRRVKDFGLSTNWSAFSKAEYKDLFHFSWFHFLVTVSVLLMGTMDMMLLPIYDSEGFNAAAVYRVPVLLISFLLIPMKAMTQASYAALARAFADDDLPLARDLFSRSSNNIFLVTVGVAVLICSNLGNIQSVLPAGYEQVGGVFLILFMGNLVNVATGVNDQVLSIAKYYRFNFYLSFLLLATLFLSLRALVTQYGVYGAALSTSVVYMLFNTVKALYIRAKLRMVPVSANTLLIIVAALPAIAIGWFLPAVFGRNGFANIAGDMALRSALVMGTYAAMVLWLKPSKDLVTYMASIRQHKRLF